MNERVLILRDAVVKITQMLSGKGIRVTQRGVSAFVTCDKDGRPNTVNLPYLPDNAPEDLCVAIQGFLDHEVAHIMFSDFSLLDKADRKNVKAMLNMLEDARIEKCMAEKFAGCGHNLAVTGEFFLKKFTEPNLKKAQAAGDTNKAIGVLMMPLIRAMSGQHVYKEFMKDKMHIVRKVYEKIADMEERIENAKSTSDCFAIAEEIKRRIREPSPPGDSGKEEGEGKDGSGNGGGSSPSKKTSISAGASGGSGGSSESEEESKGGTDGEGEGEGESSEDGGSSEDGESSSDGESKSEAEGEADGEESATPPSKPESDPNPGPEERMMELGEAAAIDEAIDKENANGYDSAMSTIISKATEESAKDAPYLVYTKEDDVIEPLKIGRGYNDKMTTDMADQVDHMVGPLQKDLERAIAARSLSTWEAGKRSGRLHSANLSRLAIGDGRVFRRRHESTSKDVAVELVVDASGSMGGSKIHLATQSAYALSSVLERIGIQHEVICFTTGPTMSGVEEESRKIGRRFSRTESLYMPVIKSFSERLNTQTRQRFGWLPHSGILRNNVDGECVETAARRLMARREKGKVMIVLSDGSPSAAGDYAAMRKHLRQTVKNIEKAGVNVVGIGIQDDSVQEFYSKNLVINNVSELPDRVVRELRHLLVH